MTKKEIEIKLLRKVAKKFYDHMRYLIEKRGFWYHSGRCRGLRSAERLIRNMRKKLE